MSEKKKVKRCYELGDEINELVITPYSGREYEEAIRLVASHVNCRCKIKKKKGE